MMYATYDEESVIWGSGESECESIIDANTQVKLYFGYKSSYPPPKLTTCVCSDELYQIIVEDGGYGIPWVIKDGVMEYIEVSEKKMKELIYENELLKKELETLKLHRSQFS